MRHEFKRPEVKMQGYFQPNMEEISVRYMEPTCVCLSYLLSFEPPIIFWGIYGTSMVRRPNGVDSPAGLPFSYPHVPQSA